MAQFQFQFRAQDEYFTPPYAVYPIMKRLQPGTTVWCPFDTADSAYVKILSDNNFRVLYGHIQTGQDFFHVDVPDCDYIISNPPYSLRNRILARLFEIGKPFAMLINFQGIFDSRWRFQLFSEHEVEMLWLYPRVAYRAGQGKQYQNAPFQSGYLCRGICQRQIEFEYLDRNDERSD